MDIGYVPGVGVRAFEFHDSANVSAVSLVEELHGE
jgi:hypothetical protein